MSDILFAFLAIQGAILGTLIGVGWHLFKTRALLREIGELILMGVVIDRDPSCETDR